MGHPEELDVVGGCRHLVERVEHVVCGQDLFDGMQVEGRHALEGHLCDDAEGAQPYPGHLEEVRVVVRA